MIAVHKIHQDNEQQDTRSRSRGVLGVSCTPTLGKNEGKNTTTTATTTTTTTTTAENTSSSPGGLEPGVLPRLAGVSRVPAGSGMLDKKKEDAQYNKEIVLALAEDSARRLEEAKDIQMEEYAELDKAFRACLGCLIGIRELRIQSGPNVLVVEAQGLDILDALSSATDYDGKDAAFRP